tara:strand:- start:3806 stop:4120 length:315 start_codon:yes stop_codon:yes gene_type:complete
MNPKDPTVIQRQQKIRDLLWAGHSITEVANTVSLSRKRIYDYAEKEELPYNPPVKAGGNKERKIVELTVAGFSKEAIGEFYRMSPAAVGKALEAVKNRVLAEAE